MVDILTHVFSACTATRGHVDAARVSGGLPCTRSALLVGGERSASRSVLLLAALSAASRGGRRVLFFTATRIQSLPPSVQSRVPHLSPDSLKMIKFCYPRTLDDLLHQVASLHEPAPTAPSLVIVDGLQSFLCGQGGGGGFHPGEQLRAAHLAALLHDTATFLTQVLERQTPRLAPCRLLASFQPELLEAGGAARGPGLPADPVLAVLDRYFAARCTLERHDGSDVATAPTGLGGVWRVSLSGAGTTDGTDRTDASQEGELVVFTNGLMEFRSV